MSCPNPVDALHPIIYAAVLLSQFGCFSLWDPPAAEGGSRRSDAKRSRASGRGRRAGKWSFSFLRPRVCASAGSMPGSLAAAVVGVARGLSCLYDPAALSDPPPSQSTQRTVNARTMHRGPDAQGTVLRLRSLKTKTG